MKDIKSKVQSLNPSIRPKNLDVLIGEHKNIYESLVVITKRARQLKIDLKKELYQKLEEFAETSDAIEEIHENKEQIEISKFYERIPNPVIISMDEFLNDEVHYRYTEKKKYYDED